MNMIGNQKISDNDVLSEITSESKASDLLTLICLHLDNIQVPYCVERNYQGYPKVLTGDIDLVFGDVSIPSVSYEIIQIALANGWKCYQKHIWDKTAYIGLSSNCFPERFTLTIELFSGARWHGISFLDEKSIVKKRLRHSITWRPDPAHQIIITVIHHLLYNGNVPTKYRQEILELIDPNYKNVEDSLTFYFGKKNSKKIALSISKNRWDLLNNKFAFKLKLNLFFRSLIFRPFSSLLDITKGLFSFYRKPFGIGIFIDISNKQTKNNFMNSILFIMTKWHIFKPPIRTIISKDLPKKIAKQKMQKAFKSGGVSISDFAYCSDFEQIFILKPYIIRQREKLEIIHDSKIIFSSSQLLSIKKANINKITLLIINQILEHRSELIKEI